MSGVNNYDDNFEKSIEDIRRRIQKISREMGWGDYYIHHKSPSENFDDLFETTSETNEKKPDSQESIDAKKARENALNNIKKQLMGK